MNEEIKKCNVCGNDVKLYGKNLYGDGIKVPCVGKKTFGAELGHVFADQKQQYKTTSEELKKEGISLGRPWWEIFQCEGFFGPGDYVVRWRAVGNKDEETK